MPHIFTDKARAKELLGVHPKPQTAVTDWIQRICETEKSLNDSVLNQFIVELVEVINLQPTGSEEASRAIRKKLKHGDVSQQKKALNLLESLVLNGGDKFQTTFADDRMVDCIKSIVFDPRTDPLIRKKTMVMLSYWAKTYKSNPKMTGASGLYAACGGQQKLKRIATSPDTDVVGTMIKGMEKDRIKSEEKSKHKTEKQRQKRMKSPIDQKFRLPLPAPKVTSSSSTSFDLEKESSNILKVVATAAQNANNLVNCLQLMDQSQSKKVTTDAKIQNHVERTKQVQKSLIRYIRLVMDHDTKGEYIGTLLNTNAQIVAALELYDLLADPTKSSAELTATANRLKQMSLQSQTLNPEPSLFDDPPTDLFDDPPDISSPPSVLSPNNGQYNSDLLGLDFGNDQDGETDLLPQPIKPDAHAPDYDPGTLSDFSDYVDSSDEEFKPTPGRSQENELKKEVSKKEDTNPFADPFI